MRRRTPTTFPWSIAALVALGGCASIKSARRYTRDEAAVLLKRFEVIGLELGEFGIDGAAAVVDGDTLRVKGLSSSMRLLALDTEETFKWDDERNAFAAGWDSYKKAMRGGAPRPVKMATPVGEEAKAWAQAFFEGVPKVKIERDHPGEIRDYYGRYLTYVLVEKNRQWVNFNLECVRAGMSPYFTKYGRSRRFHQAFIEAQRQAQEAKRGIWDPAKQHYDDYDERLAWWSAREAAVTRFEKQAEESPHDYIALTRWDALLKLEQKIGRTVTLLGAVSEIRLGDQGPTVVKLSRTRGNDFDVVFFDKDVLLASGILQNKGEFVQVRGVVNRYIERARNIPRLQIVVGLPGQVLAPSDELDALLAAEPKEGAKPAEPD